MNEQEARSIERQLAELLPGCLVEAYFNEDADYQKKEFVVSWKVSVYSSMEKFGNLVCVIRDSKHRDALLAVCSSYYNRRKEIEEDDTRIAEMGTPLHLKTPGTFPQGKAFVDQTGQTVIQDGVYGVDEHGDLYDLEPVERIRPSEY